MSAARACGLVAVSALVLAACDPEVGALRDLEAERAEGAVDGGTGAPADASPPARVSFARDLRPILARADGPPAGCRRCHYRDEPGAQGYQVGGLDMTTLGTLRRGGNTSGRGVIVAGDPDRSVIVRKLEGTYDRGARMPKDLTPLSRDEIALFRRWIGEGAVGSDDE